MTRSAAVATALLAGAVWTPFAATSQTLERVSVAADGTEGDGESRLGTISADGRYVAFDSLASNLVQGDTNGARDIFVHDREKGTAERVSVASDGTEANDASGFPVISPDGRYVVFASEASNLVPDDTNGDIIDIFVHDRETGITERVSVASDGTEQDNGAFASTISADGRYVAFESAASNLVPDDTNGVTDAFVHDRETGITERVSVASDGSEGNGHANIPAISADGRYVAFASEASNLVPEDTNGLRDTFVHDRQFGTTERVSVTADGSECTGGSPLTGSLPYSISPDGRYILLDSGCTNLVPGDTNSRRDSFVHDRQTGITERVSVASDGTEGNLDSFGGGISADGRYATFFSSASNLVPGDTNGRLDAFAHDRETGITKRLSVAPDGTEGDGNSFTIGSGVTPDGRYIALHSNASNLVPEDTNGAADVFIHIRPEGAPELAFDPPGLDFGEVEVGETSPPQSATLENVGDTEATGLTFPPPGNGFDADTSECGDILAAGETCEISVTFTPSEPGSAEASLEVTSDQDASASLGLAGLGVAGGESFTAMVLQVDPEAVDSDGNGVFEPGEVVEVAPAWRNDGTTPQSLSGGASDLIGPDGAKYALVLDEASYGTLDPDQTASCLETGVCYQVSVDDPAVRPAAHWEATFEENLSDNTVKTWTLHIGESFADVSRTNLFYPSVETLLHHGITGGCAGTEYCPAASNTRDQMPVFVLKALLGPDYQPPACVEGDEVFDDVAADNLFCPWIEDLFNRGVVNGCGGDNYCPNAPVTRAQMAIFLLRTLEGSDYTPPACAGVFVDVPCPSLFADWIEDLFAREITGGCSSQPLRYCPANPVNREQMAAFIGKAFGLTLYGP